MLGGLFNSSSTTRQDLDSSQRINNTVSEGGGSSFANNLGGLRVQGGKKSTSTVNIRMADFGAIQSGEKVARESLAFAGDTVRGAFEAAAETVDFGRRASDQAAALSGSAMDLARDNSAASVADGFNRVLWVFLGVAAIAGAAFIFKGR